MHSKFDQIILKVFKESLQSGSTSQVPDVEKMKISQKVSGKENSQETINNLIKQIEDLKKETEERNKQLEVENKKREEDDKKQQSQLQDFQRKMLITQMAPKQEIQSTPNKNLPNLPTQFDKIIGNFSNIK